MRGDTLQGGDTRVKSISESDEQEKGRQFFQEKINRPRGDTAELAEGDD